MSGRTSSFSLEQHQITGQQIFNARVFFGELYIGLAKSYGKTATPVRLAEDIIHAIDRLRDSLNEVVCTENPDREERELNRCYYSIGS